MTSIKRREIQTISGAIFDLDGTLLDTMVQWNELGVNYLREHGIAPKQDMIDRIGTMSLRESAEMFRAEYGVQKSIDELIQELVARLKRIYTDEARLKPGATEVLRALKRSGVEIALATATTNELARAGLRRNAALKYFDGIFSCRDAEIRESKASPKIFDYARKFLGSPLDETIVVEDALYAIETAKNAGYFVVAIEEETERSRKDAIIETADLYFASHIEFAEWLRFKLV